MWKINFNLLSAALPPVGISHFSYLFWLKGKHIVLSFIFTTVSLVKLSFYAGAMAEKCHAITYSRRHRYLTRQPKCWTLSMGRNNFTRAQNPLTFGVCSTEISVCFLIMTLRIMWGFEKDIACGRGAQYQGLTVSFTATWPDPFYRPGATLVSGNVIMFLCQSPVPRSWTAGST